ncbi:DUF4367 domain-containing protein [Caldanaerovirga acetigignens]|nr:DUF4367 domain-containing protein [Caldanaerovirga acetigignens]
MKKDKDAFELYLSKKIKECAEYIPVPKHIEDEIWAKIKREDEVQKNVGFQIAVPEYLPEGYGFHGAKISGGGKNSVILIYRKGTEGEELRIEQFSVARETAFSHNFRTNDVEVKDLNIKGSEATLIHFKKSGLRQLLYENGSTFL